MKDTSGSAFPLFDADNNIFQSGMTKRELVAMHVAPHAPGNAYEHEERARWAVAYADALLKELEK